MKKFLLMVAVAFSAATYAQTEKGNWMAGSDLGLSFNSVKTTPRYDGRAGDDLTENTFKFTPNINYFVINNLAVGLGLSYENTTAKVRNNETKKNTFIIAPNATYFFPIGGKLAPFVGAKVGFASQSEGKDDSQKYRGLTLGAKGGIAYFVNEGAAITGYLGYDYYRLTQKKDNKYEQRIGNFGVGIGVALFF
ncbi:outer membrane beta-barrel protein [Capnocytophaga sputigena]|jgi:hypothetical protein|uniref:outer membrane beta-barrel protein n=1 Tax=Capnocytophaga sputigena TaxID=1019 RepID=UPI0028D2077F|nr:outer membrane beta-barrel protein [Capnocytophaga sputigena]